MLSPSSTADAAQDVLRLRVTGSPDALEPARRRLHDVLVGQLSARAMYRVEVVLEEVLMNVMLHAHDDMALHDIGLEVRLRPDAVEMHFEDDGKPFDPTGVRDLSQPSTLEDARPGGLGLVLVRKSAKALVYERRDGRNRLRVDIERV